MAGPLEAINVAPPGPRDRYTGPLGDVGWGLAWLDYLIYSVEYVTVVVAMVAMTVIEFVYITSLYVTEQKIAFAQLRDPAINAPIPWNLAVLLAFIALMMTAVVNQGRLGNTPDGTPRPLPIKAAAVAGLTVAVAALAGLSLWVESSSTYYLILASLIMLPSTAFFFKTNQQGRGYLMVGLTALAYLTAWNVPEGYSWADKQALFLLLWVGFLGASMAARQWRHLKIDIARKLCPEAWLPRFNGLSFLVAAAFTSLMVYLGYIYLFHPDYGRFWVETIEGEIPDWLKVVSIPLALLLITLRFGARGLSLLIWGDRYSSIPTPQTVGDPLAEDHTPTHDPADDITDDPDADDQHSSETSPGSGTKKTTGKGQKKRRSKGKRS